MTASDPDAGERFTFGVVGGADELKFSIGGSNNDELILNDGVLDFESQDSYTVVVRATDSALQTYDETLTVNVNDQNDNTPVIDTAQSLSVSEAAADGTSLGTITALDADDGTVLSNWTISAGNSDGIFFINSSTGELTVIDNANLDFETTPTYLLSVTVSDGVQTSAVETVTINVTNVNETPTVANPIADQSATQDTPLSFQFAANTFDDVDGDALTYTATLDDSSPLPAWLTFDAATRTFSGTPANGDVGPITVRGDGRGPESGWDVR